MDALAFKALGLGSGCIEGLKGSGLGTVPFEGCICIMCLPCIVISRCTGHIETSSLNVPQVMGPMGAKRDVLALGWPFFIILHRGCKCYKEVLGTSS